MNRHPSTFSVGDYIGDIDDVCWRVDVVTEKEYTITYVPENISKKILREAKPSNYRGKDNETNYAENYHLLRPCGHEDITNFPIGSEWKCLKKSGLNDPEKDTVIIESYSFSKGVFWICDSKRKSFRYIAYKEDLCSLTKDNMEEDLEY